MHGRVLAVRPLPSVVSACVCARNARLREPSTARHVHDLRHTAVLAVLRNAFVHVAEGTFHVDALRAGLAVTPLPGETIAKLDAARDFPWLKPSSQQARDVARFARIANGFVAVDKAAPRRVVDLRYSLVPNEIAGFWAIVLEPAAGSDEHVDYITTREQAPEQARRLLAMLF